MENLIFIVLDTILFFLLWLGAGFNWIAAFFSSTALTWLLFFAFYALWRRTG